MTPESRKNQFIGKFDTTIQPIQYIEFDYFGTVYDVIIEHPKHQIIVESKTKTPIPNYVYDPNGKVYHPAVDRDVDKQPNPTSDEPINSLKSEPVINAWQRGIDNIVDSIFGTTPINNTTSFDQDLKK